MGLNADQGGLDRSRRLGIACNVGLIIVLGAALAFLTIYGVQRLSWSQPLRFDVTADQRYALDPLTERLLGELESDLEITFVVGFDKGILDRVADQGGRPRGELLARWYQPVLQAYIARVQAVLREWSQRSPRVSARVLWQPSDPAAVETFARSVGRQVDGVLNRVLFDLAGRRREITLTQLGPDMRLGSFAGLPESQGQPPRSPRTWRVHEEMTAALRSLLEGETTRIGILTEIGGAYEPTRRETWEVIISITRDAGFELVPLPAASLTRVPPDVEAVMVLAPDAEVPESATAALVEWESREGGRLLIVPGAVVSAPFAQLVEPYGVRLEADVVTDRRLTNPLRGAAHQLESNRMYRGSHPVVAGLVDSGIRCFVGLSRSMSLLPDHASGATRTQLLAADRNSRLAPVRRGRDGGYEVAAERVARGVTAAPIVGLALERPAGLGDGNSRVVAFSGQGIVSPGELIIPTVFANRDLLLNALRWLTDRDRTLGITPRDQVRGRLMDVRDLEGPFTLFAVWLLPGLALIGGGLVWWNRRSS